jgi:hypothetical protein
LLTQVGGPDNSQFSVNFNAPPSAGSGQFGLNLIWAGAGTSFSLFLTAAVQIDDATPVITSINPSAIPTSQSNQTLQIFGTNLGPAPGSITICPHGTACNTSEVQVVTLGSSCGSPSQLQWCDNEVDIAVSTPSMPMAPDGLYDLTLTSGGESPVSSFLAEQGAQPTSARTGPKLIIVQLGCAAVSQIIQQYINQVVPDVSLPGSPPFIPLCSYFRNGVFSQYYSFTQLGNIGIGKQPFTWALVKNPLVVDQSSGYGLSAWTNLLSEDGWGLTQTINSSYRPPVYNNQFSSGKFPGGRHQFGDAIDVANVLGTQAEHDIKACFAGRVAATNFGQLAATCSSLGITQDAGADWVEPNNSQNPCKLVCVHADWRDHDYNVYQ